jgi:hypothetical protein
MGGRSRPPETLRPYAPERFEYRIWGTAFAELPAPDAVAESVEVYLLPRRDGSNVKIRGGALEIKRLIGMQDGLQRWLPAWRGELPLPGSALERAVCPALGVAPPPLARRRYDVATLLAEVVPALAGVRAVHLRKRRRQFNVAGARAERTRVVVGEITLESAAVEAERFEDAARATEQLMLRRAPNLDYVAALRRLLAGPRPDAEVPLQPWG